MPESNVYIMKYNRVKIWPVRMNGVSTGHAPIQVSRMTLLNKVQRIVLFIGKNWIPLILLFLIMGIINRIAIEVTNAITPPNLLGIDRKIA